MTDDIETLRHRVAEQGKRLASLDASMAALAQRVADLENGRRRNDAVVGFGYERPKHPASESVNEDGVVRCKTYREGPHQCARLSCSKRGPFGSCFADEEVTRR